MLHQGSPQGDRNVWLVAPSPEQLPHLPYIAANSGPTALDDRFLPNVEDVFKSVFEAPDAYVFGVLVDDKLAGFIYFTQVWLERMALVHAYGYPMHPYTAARAMKLALGWAFDKWRLAKVFTTHAELNQGVTLAALKAGMSIEATIQGDRYHGGKPFNSVVLGITREDWLHGRRG